MDDKKFEELEHTIGARYHKVKFFDRRKVSRRLGKVQRLLDALAADPAKPVDPALLAAALVSTGAGSDEGSSSALPSLPHSADDQVAALTALQQSLRLDLLFIRWYPRHEKYLSLVPRRGSVDPALEARRATMRAWALRNAAARDFLRTDPAADADAAPLDLVSLAARAANARKRRAHLAEAAATADEGGASGDDDGSDVDDGEEEEADVADSDSDSDADEEDGEEEEAEEQAGEKAKLPTRPVGRSDAARAPRGSSSAAAVSAVPAHSSGAREAALKSRPASAAASMRLQSTGVASGAALRTQPGALRLVRNAALDALVASDEEDAAATTGVPPVAQRRKQIRPVPASATGARAADGRADDGAAGDDAAPASGDGSGDAFFATAPGDAAADPAASSLPVFREERWTDADVEWKRSNEAVAEAGGGSGPRHFFGPRTSAARFEREHLGAGRYRGSDRAAPSQPGGRGFAAPSQRADSSGPPAAAAATAAAADLSHLSGRNLRRAQRAAAFSGKQAGGGSSGGGGSGAADAALLQPWHGNGRRYTESFFGTERDPGARLRSSDLLAKANRQQAKGGGGEGGYAPPPRYQGSGGARSSAGAPAPVSHSSGGKGKHMQFD